MPLESYIFASCTFVVGLLTNSFLPKYFGKKGENLATKEDISEITNKMETVKHDYARQLESTKAELSAQLNTHGFRYEKEYEVLSELTALLVEVRDASLSLRPVMDSRDSSKKDDEIKKERLQRLFEADRALYISREKKRPFYPPEIYEAVLAVEKSARSESINYQFKDRFDGNVMSYWEEAEKHQKEIASLADVAMQHIRSRVTKWEALPGNF
jgi:hypothetical protein